MGMHITMYLGPCARCKIERVSKFENGCLKKDCRNFRRSTYSSSGDFCSACGSSFGKFEVQNAVEKVDHTKLFGGSESLASYVNDEYSRATHRLFVPNYGAGYRGQPRGFGFDPQCDIEEVIFAGNQPQPELEWFLGAYREELGALCNAYGQDNVTVHWMRFGAAV